MKFYTQNIRTKKKTERHCSFFMDFRNARQLGSFGKEFGELFPTHLIDLRNHGKSFHSDEMNHQVLAEDILNYMNFHGIEKANLLGHSLGGKAP